MRGNGLARGHTADRIDAMKVFVSALDEGRLPGPAHRLRRSPTATAKRNKNKEVLMVKSSLYAAIGFAAVSSIALAEDLSSATAPLPPRTFTTSAHSTNGKLRTR